MSLSTDYILTSLQELYGESVTGADIRAWCAMNGSNYQTVSNKLSDYKVSRGKWNLTVQEKLEQTYQAPPAMPVSSKTLFLLKMIPSSSLVILAILKKLLSPVYFILRLLPVFLVMVKRSLLSKRVLNLVGNLSV